MVKANLYLFISCITISALLSAPGCAERRGDMSETADPQAGLELYRWTQERVKLMITHKADCDEMADALLRHHRDTQDQLSSWRARGAGVWLKQRAEEARRESMLRDVTRDDLYHGTQAHADSVGLKFLQLIARADIVYYHCAQRDRFRSRLTSADLSPQ